MPELVCFNVAGAGLECRRDNLEKVLVPFGAIASVTKTGVQWGEEEGIHCTVVNREERHAIKGVNSAWEALAK